MTNAALPLELSRTRVKLRLFVTGRTSQSRRAVSNLRATCEAEFGESYELSVIDVLERPALADAAKIVATPTLLRWLPEPVGRVVGDLSDREVVLFGLDVASCASKGRTSEMNAVGRLLTARRKNTDMSSARRRLIAVRLAEILKGMDSIGEGTTRVLVIDDSLENQQRLCSLLMEAVEVRAVGCSSQRDEALRAFAELQPACAVVDVPVRDGAGFELLEALRAHDPRCLLIILTNHTSEEFKQRALRAGADHFLVKSVEFEQVAELVRGLGGAL